MKTDELLEISVTFKFVFPMFEIENFFVALESIGTALKLMSVSDTFISGVKPVDILRDVTEKVPNPNVPFP